GGANTYTWDNGPQTNTYQVSPNVTTVYSVTATDINGCIGNNTMTLTVNPNPTVTATANPTLMCKFESNAIVATTTNTYSWSTTATTPSFVLSPTVAATQVLTVVGTDTNGCTSTTSLTIKINNCTGIDEAEQLDVSLLIYPNPGKDIFNIEIQNPTGVT